MTPYEWICQLMSRDGSVQKQSGLYQTMTPFFLLQPLENRQFNMCLNGTCVSLCAPLIAVAQIAVLQDCSHNIYIFGAFFAFIFYFFHMGDSEIIYVHILPS